MITWGFAAKLKIFFSGSVFICVTEAVNLVGTYITCHIIILFHENFYTSLLNIYLLLCYFCNKNYHSLFKNMVYKKFSYIIAVITIESTEYESVRKTLINLFVNFSASCCYNNWIEFWKPRSGVFQSLVQKPLFS